MKGVFRTVFWWRAQTGCYYAWAEHTRAQYKILRAVWNNVHCDCIYKCTLYNYTIVLFAFTLCYKKMGIVPRKDVALYYNHLALRDSWSVQSSSYNTLCCLAVLL